MWIQEQKDVKDRFHVNERSYVNVNTGMRLKSGARQLSTEKSSRPAIYSCSETGKPIVIYNGDPVEASDSVVDMDMKAIIKANNELDRLVLRLNGGLQHTWS